METIYLNNRSKRSLKLTKAHIANIHSDVMRAENNLLMDVWFKPFFFLKENSGALWPSYEVLHCVTWQARLAYKDVFNTGPCMS